MTILRQIEPHLRRAGIRAVARATGIHRVSLQRWLVGAQTLSDVQVQAMAKCLGLRVHIEERTMRTKAFTLIELLIVVAIVAVLIALALPALGRARNRARDTACLANLGQIGTAYQGVYASTRHYPRTWADLDLPDRARTCPRDPERLPDSGYSLLGQWQTLGLRPAPFDAWVEAQPGPVAVDALPRHDGYRQGVWLNGQARIVP